jgi:hypothetical protein
MGLFTHPPPRDSAGDATRLSRLRPALEVRDRAICAVREFFHARGFLEVETPVRLPAPALELHIDAEPSGRQFLRTSPELHMKRLLASGYERITKSFLKRWSVACRRVPERRWEWIGWSCCWQGASPFRTLWLFAERGKPLPFCLSLEAKKWHNIVRE